MAQVAFLAAVAAVGWYLFSNMQANLRQVGIPTGFGFLDQPTGFVIPDSDFRSTQSNLDALVVGIGNTARVALVGIALATVVGVVVGVARLSTNWLVRTGAAIYVEALRNVPVLVLIVFAFTAVFLKLPPIDDAIEWLGVVVFSNRGSSIPWARTGPGAGVWWAAVGLGLVGAGVVAVWRTRRSVASGRPHHRLAWGGAVVVGVAVAGYLLLGTPLQPDLPSRDGRVVTGGFRLGTEYSALLVALVVYTASHIAEVVRGSILAVPRGQAEAASALALSGFQRLRFVILPQALRIAVPPLGNQYLNLTKNSSLAVAIGFPEVTRLIRSLISQGSPAPQAVAVLMLIYLGFSLALSLVVNLFNRRLTLVDR